MKIKIQERLYKEGLMEIDAPFYLYDYEWFDNGGGMEMVARITEEGQLKITRHWYGGNEQLEHRFTIEFTDQASLRLTPEELGPGLKGNENQFMGLLAMARKLLE